MASNEDHRESSRKQVTANRKARFNYQVVESVEAGLVLVGTEVKSLRAGKCQLQDAYAAFEGQPGLEELWIIGMHIAPYEHGTHGNHEARRKRKLLLKRHELRRLHRKVQEKGLTIVALSVFFDGPYAKIELGLVRGKRAFDKRESIKKRDVERRMREE